MWRGLRLNTPPVSAKAEFVAISRASAKLPARNTASTGPNISSQAISESGATSVNTVGGT